MNIYEFDNINEFTVNMIKEIRNNGKIMNTRNGKATQLFDNSIIINNPRARNLYLHGRTNNIYATWSEIIWVFSGNNKLNPLMNFMLPRAKDYSDDGETWRGAYSSRLYEGDQLNNIVNLLKSDKNSRQGVFTIWNPLYDTKQSIKNKYNLEYSKDIPCNNIGWVWIEDNKLNMKVGIRSNDLIFGASAINIPEWTVLQEIIYELLLDTYPDLELGYYNHSPINLHYYDSVEKQVNNIINSDNNVNDIGELTKLNLKLNNFTEIRKLFEDIYNILCSAIERYDRYDNQHYIDIMIETFLGKTRDELNNSSLFLYSMFTLLYILYKSRSKEDNLFSNLYLNELKVFFNQYYDEDLDICKSIKYCKFTPSTWLSN